MFADSPLKRLLKFLFQDRPAWVSYLIAFAIAIPYILSLFPLDFLSSDSHAAFLGKGHFLNHVSQHISGWWAFMADKWRFPLLETKLLNAPEGANIALPIAYR